MEIKIQHINSAFVALLILLLSLHAKSATEIIDRIAVVVDEDVIMQSELSERFKEIKTKSQAKKMLECLQRMFLNSRLRTK